jgi:hypothetical protein
MPALALLLSLLVLALLPASSSAATDPCAPGGNAIACENSKPGAPPSQWETVGAGDPELQGYSTKMSVQAGDTVSFKIKTDFTGYTIDIYRLGYYGGDGARLIQSGIRPSVSLPQTQPDCLTDSSTGLIDCGNWAVSATWNVPAGAVSGVYIARLQDTAHNADSQIPFVVRNDASHSDMLVQTSDATWEAYNAYGGNSLYTCTVACPPGNPRAYKAAFAVSYNRPFDGSLKVDGGHSYLYNAEYQLIRFLEKNGYDVSYTSEADVDRSATALMQHKVLISSGHDEYWSGAQRAHFEQARDAGTSLAFFSGNEVFWKTRYGPSIDGTNTPQRTITSYKDTHFDAPTDPTAWTGTWQDPRFSPPGDGGRPQNSLTGQLFTINSGTTDIQVPGSFAKLRMWRNTAIAGMQSGQTATLAPGTGLLGYEWDEDIDNGSRPAGLIRLSRTSATDLQKFQDFGTVVQWGNSGTHSLTLYRASSGALVFGAGTVQWSWGLDSTDAWDNFVTTPGNNPPDPTVQQATVNLFADMGASPSSLDPALVQTVKSQDATAPTATVSPPAGNVANGSKVTLTGSASDAGGGVVAGIEVSTDDGATWHPADLTGPAAASVGWTYPWIARSAPTAKIKVRATDDSGNIGTPSATLTVPVDCPCSLFGQMTPRTTDSGDTNSVVLGVKFKADTFGTINGVRFFKAATNTGSHVGSLWSSSGQLLASATFTNESASGWQEVRFAQPVTVQAGATYVATYLAPSGHYSVSGDGLWGIQPLDGDVTNSPPLHALKATPSSGNGVFRYGTVNAFPTQTHSGDNYWVDVLYSPQGVPGKPLNVNATAGAGSAIVDWDAPTGGGAPSTYTVTPLLNGTTAQPSLAKTVDASTTTVTFTNTTVGSTYRFVVRATNPTGDGPDSDPSNAVVPAQSTPPSAPVSVTAAPAGGSARVSWQPPVSDGGLTISRYTVTPFDGTTAGTPVQVSGTTTSAVVNGLTNGRQYTFRVFATNSDGDSATATSAAVRPNPTIFELATPAADSTDKASTVLGVKFTADQYGRATGLRFYKGVNNIGTHVGALWNAAGNQLATVTFQNESASGWQHAEFSSPVELTPGATYVASYLAPKGNYSFTSAAFSTAGIGTSPLTALGSPTSPNGVYSYSTTMSFPTSSFNATNYWVDVFFSPDAVPGAVTNVSAAPALGGATVTWNAPTTGGRPTSYRITPYIGSAAQPATTVKGTPAPTSAAIKGLSADQTYTFTVRAVNPQGDGPESSPSNAITPTGDAPPTEPLAVTATAAGGSATVSWSPPTDTNGRPVTGYVVTPFRGTTADPAVTVDASTTSTRLTGLTNGVAYTFKVAATNANGTGPQSTASNPVKPGATIFDWTSPAGAESTDKSSTNLGVKFTADVNGTVTGIRFYKQATNVGTHVASLWSATGTLLAQGTFTGETASGWQEVDFATPVPITAGTTYVASYLAPKGRYSFTQSAFNTAIVRAPLRGVDTATSPNGVYGYSAATTFPTSSVKATNYWVDVLFTPGT